MTKGIRMEVVSLFLVLGLPLFCFAEESSSQDAQPPLQGLPIFTPTKPGQAPPSPEEMQRSMQEMQAKEMEQLKKFSPQMYEERKTALEWQKKIDVIVLAYRSGALSAQEAERDLYPLLKQEMKPQEMAKGLDAQIARLERKLDFLKKAKADPDLLVKKRIDELLGVSSMPTPDEMAMPGEMY
jgi:hypothetical protein